MQGANDQYTFGQPAQGRDRNGINIPFVNLTRSAGTGIPFVDFDSNNPQPTSNTPGLSANLNGVSFGAPEPQVRSVQSTPQQIGAYNPATAAQTAQRAQDISFVNQGFDTKIAGLRSQLDLLTPQQQAAELRTQNQFTNQGNQLNTGLAQGQRNLNYSRNQVEEDRTRGLKSVRDQLAEKAMSYSNQLGAYGAGDSSATGMINFALAGQSSRNRGEVMGGASDQLNQIGMQEKDLMVSFEQNKKALDDWKQTTLADLATQFSQQKYAIQNEMANADLSRQQQLAQYDASVTRAALDRLSMIQQNYAQQTSELTSKYQNIFAPQDIRIAPNLQQYEVKALDEGTLAGLRMPTAVNPESELAVALKRRDEEQLQNPLAF